MSCFYSCCLYVLGVLASRISEVKNYASEVLTEERLELIKKRTGPCVSDYFTRLNQPVSLDDVSEAKMICTNIQQTILIDDETLKIHRSRTAP